MYTTCIKLAIIHKIPSISILFICWLILQRAFPLIPQNPWIRFPQPPSHCNDLELPAFENDAVDSLRDVLHEVPVSARRAHRAHCIWEEESYVMIIMIITRSSWLNCALRDDKALYWVSIGHHEAAAVGNWWYCRGHLCLYILHKVEIWTGVTDAWLTDRLWKILLLSSL